MPEELAFKVYIEVLLFDGADRRVLGRQILQSSLPMNAALTSLMVDEPLRVASWRRVSVSGPVLALALGARLVPRSRVSRVSAVVSARRCAFSVVRVLEGLVNGALCLC